VQRQLQVGKSIMKFDDYGMGRSIARVLATTVWLAGVTIPGIGIASNFGFLKDAPITRFTGQDLEIFQSTLYDTLNQNADGSTRHWENPKTGSAGEIVIVKSFAQDSKRCRRVRISNRARGYAETKTDMVFCKETTDQWKVSPPSKKPTSN
jgi:surface antigen